MMLPSGNDAAYLIAEVGGAMARMLKEGKVDVEVLEDVDGVEELLMRGNNVSLFLKEMNRIACELGMGSSNFANPHGLANPANYSTALDLCKLATHAMNQSLFRAIVSTQIHHYHAQLPRHLPSDSDKENRHPNELSFLIEKPSLISSKW